MSEKRNVPKLRFKEFAGEWTERKLGDAFSNSRKKGAEGIPIFSVSQSKGLVPRESLDRVIQNDAKAEQNIRVEQGEIAYNMMRMWQGAYGISETTCMVSPAYVVLKPKKENSSKFFSYQFEKPRSKYLFTTYSHGLTLDRLRLYFDDFASIPTTTPSLPEQQKIAEFLTAVDRRIELLQAKKEKLEAYKKGVMQKIFPSTGSGQVPELRFKADDGSDFPDWEEKKLGEVCEIVKGQQLNRSELFESGDFPAMNGGISPSGYTDVWNTAENTITISEGGNSCGYVSYMKTKFWCGGHCYTVQKLNKEITTDFLFQALKFNQDGIMALRVGSGLPNIQKKDILKFKILIPTLQEQIKIVQFLTSLDKSIENLNQQITHTQTWKKGLLQKMFV